MSITGTERDLPSCADAFLERCEKFWPSGTGGPRLVTRSPGRLDCMGGLADFNGALALQMPIELSVHVAVGRREDQKIHVASIGWNQDDQPGAFEWPLSAFYQSDGQIVTAGDLAARFDACPWARHVAGVCLALLESGDVPHFAGGLTLVLHSEIPSGMSLASSAAIQVACAKAVSALFGADLSASTLARACRVANTEVVGAEAGLVDHVTCLSGEPDALLQIRCQPDDVLGTLQLPKGVTLLGVETGVRLPIRHQRYADNRASSMVGRFIIERLLLGSGDVGDPSGGHLANVSPAEYVRRFRDALPVKLRGADFLDHFGQPDDLEVQIDAGQVYKVRSRTEHHIYENHRTHRFMERLARARRTGELDALAEAGELMYASHWSYGQRCGLGSIETDVLVNLIRDRGAGRGLYGAKVTGGGCGGTVAVLMADTSSARESLEESLAEYATRTGKTPTLRAGSSPGAMAFGCRILE